LIAFAISSVFISFTPDASSNSAAASFTLLLYALLKSPIIDLNSTPVTLELPSGKLNIFFSNNS